MAILKNGILGPVFNKVGTVIGRNFRGLNVITQLYRKSQKPPTTKQKQAQTKLGMLSTFLSRAQGIIEPGFIKTAKGGQSVLNAAYSLNYPNVFIEDVEGFKINFPKMVLSRGPVERPNCATVKREANKIVFSWLAQAENKYSRLDDSASFLMYGEGKKKMRIMLHKVQRSDLKFEFELHETLQSDVFHCYMVFNSHNNKLVGNSEYVGAS